MFKLTKEEQKVVAFLVGVLLLGTAVKQWRAIHPTEQSEHRKMQGQRE